MLAGNYSYTSKMVLCNQCYIEGGYEIEQQNGQDVWIYTGAPTSIVIDPAVESATVSGMTFQHYIGNFLFSNFFH